MSTLARPQSIQELESVLADPTLNRLRVRGTGTKQVFIAGTPAPSGVLDMSGIAGIVQHDVDDQIVTVRCGTPVQELQEALAHRNQQLPLPQTGCSLIDGVPGTVGGMIAMLLPHGLDSMYGSPREWLLHAEVGFGGEIAKSGAKVVKSVAGYDVHKLYAGSRGWLGPIVTVTLRTWTRGRLAETGAESRRAWNGQDLWICRTTPSLFAAALEKAQSVLAIDRASCTLWADMEPEKPQEGWVMGPRGQILRDHPTDHAEARLRRAFDPEGRWV